MNARPAFPLLTALVLTLLATPACAKSEDAPSVEAVASGLVGARSMAAAPAVAAAAAPPGVKAQDEASNATAGEAASERRVIRNADLVVAARDGAALKDKATRLMGQIGGYVAGSSESHGETGEGWSAQMTLKVPVARLDAALAELRGYGERVVRENVSSQDVTAEFFDLEARLKAQRAVEAQMMAIAKEARTVPDLLEVQRRLGDVRVEIERMEGRRNQLEHQTSLSTIQLTIQRPAPPPPPRVEADGSLGATVKLAASDALGVGRGLVHGSIRVVGVLVPLALFFAPLGLAARWLRRWRAARLVRA